MMGWKFESLQTNRIPHICVDYLKALIENSDVVGRPEYGQVTGIYNKGVGPAIKFEVQVNLPSRPIVSINDKEPLLILFFKGKIFPPAIFSARNNFPDLPHVMRRRKNGPAEICYIRESPNDWAIDKTFADVIQRLRDWLADAASGKLVKSDERYEPLWISANNGMVELDGELAKDKTKNGSHVWECQALEQAMEGLKYFQVNDRQGSMPVKVYYQPEISNKPWTLLTSLPDDVCELSSELGRDVRPVIESASKEAHLSRFLLIFGVRRSRIVNGRQDADEWIACLFRRNRTKKGALVGASKRKMKKKLSLDEIWTVKPLQVRSPFTTKLAYHTSGWKSKIQKCNIAIIGAGALGSKVTDSLVRSGLVEVLLIDSDILAPHNLARHTLRSNDLGFYKAKKIADYLNSLYPTENKIVTPYCENFIDGVNELCEELNKCKFIIDLSASKAVQKVLANMRLSGSLCVPVLTAFMAKNGELTFLLIDGKIKEINADVIEAELISKHTEKEFVKKWLLSSEDILDAGGGCRLLTTKVPDSLISCAAGWISQNISSLITSQEPWSNEGKIGVMDVTESGGVWDSKTEWFNVPEPKLIISSGWKICISKRIQTDIEQKCRARNAQEVCGILLGKVSKSAKMAFVTNIWESPGDGVGYSNYCQRGREGLRIKLVDNLKSTGEQEGYLGEWHSHPVGATRMSALDFVTSKGMAERLKEFGIPAILVITNGMDADAYVITN